MSNSSQKDILTNLQVLRALAAYGVIFHHVIDALENYLLIGQFNAVLKVGSTGVDVFFVISGYIMMKSTSNSEISPKDFLRHRIIRVVPIYWLLTIASFIVILLGFSLFAQSTTSIQRLLFSLFFIPDIVSDESIRMPILFVGWSLNYEMMFYCIFAACLFFKNQWYRIISIMLFFVLLWILQEVSTNQYLDYFGHDRIWAFALGVLIFPFFRMISLTPLISWGLVLFSFIGLASVDYLPILGLNISQALLSCSAAGLVLAVLMLEKSGLSFGNGFLCRQGDISYSLYLIHPFIIQIIGKIAIVTGLNHSIAGLVSTVIAIFICSAMAADFLFHFVEKPTSSYIKKRRLEIAIRGSD